VFAVSTPDEAAQMFRRLAGESDATFDIAPELDGLLLERRQVVVDVGGLYLGPTAEAIELCADKFWLAEHLTVNGIPTIETWLSGNVGDDLHRILPAVVKRRDGAGSLSMQLIHDAEAWGRMRESFAPEDWDEQMIVQPFVPGRALSVAAIFGRDGRNVELFPAGAQHLSDDGSFQYCGGRIPAIAVDQHPLAELVRHTVEVVPGLTGYVGFDILLPDGSPETPLLVEINPRLTTSYLGYRALTDENLAERILFPERRWRPITWKGGGVEFAADGVLCQKS
jgi:predicted ATP-grasp superfamily ATP-dependent carboligase